MAATATERRVNVLCQCGWGRLAIPESQVPNNCPMCGFDFYEYADAQSGQEDSD